MEMFQNKEEKAALASPLRGGEGIKESWISFIHDLQDKICAALETADGRAKFEEDDWQRAEGGGGKTRVISHGDVFEKGGVNTSVVFGEASPKMRKELGIDS